jgi:hypothetical protein
MTSLQALENEGLPFQRHWMMLQKKKSASSGTEVQENDTSSENICMETFETCHSFNRASSYSKHINNKLLKMINISFLIALFGSSVHGLLEQMSLPRTKTMFHKLF